MNEHSELLAETRREVETALGGRFREGAECPYVLELFRLAFADAHAERSGNNAERLSKHLELCPVCRHTYHAALAGAGELVAEAKRDLTAAVATAYVGQRPAESGSMLDEFDGVTLPPDAMLRVWRAGPAGPVELAGIVPTEPAGWSVVGALPLQFERTNGACGLLDSQAAPARSSVRTYRGVIPLQDLAGVRDLALNLVLQQQEGASTYELTAVLTAPDETDVQGFELEIRARDQSQRWVLKSDDVGNLQLAGHEAAGPAYLQLPRTAFSLLVRAPGGVQLGGITFDSPEQLTGRTPLSPKAPPSPATDELLDRAPSAATTGRAVAQPPTPDWQAP